MDTRQRILTSILVVLAGVAAPAAARAAEAEIAYDLPSADLTGMRIQLGGGMAGCALGCASVRMRAGAAVPAGSRSVIAFAAPAGTTIARAVLRLRWRTQQAGASVRVQSQLGGRWIELRRLRSAKATSGTVAVAGGGTAIAVALAADAAIPARRVPSEGANAATVESARLIVRDAVAPVVTWVGAPESGAWQRGTVCGGFAASDVGLGVDRVEYAVGTTLATATAGAGTRLQPRPLGLSGQICADTAQLADGTYGTALTAVDSGVDGNRSAPVQGIIRVDNTAPSVAYQPPADAEARVPHAQLTVADGASGVERVAAAIDGVPAVVRTFAGTTDVAPAAPLADGTHVLTWEAVDAAGNAASGRELFGVLDATPPVIDDAQPQGSATPDAAVRAHAADAGAGVDPLGWRVAVDGVDMTGAAEIAPDGTLTLRPLRPWGEGEHVVRVSVADRSGNRATRSWTFALPIVPAPVPAPPATVPDPVPAAVAPDVAEPESAKVATPRLPVAALRLAVESRRVRAGARVVLRGRLTGADAEQVRIEARVGERWRPVVIVPVTASGAFSTPVRLPAPGTYAVRARVGPLRSHVVRLIAR